MKQTKKALGLLLVLIMLLIPLAGLAGTSSESSTTCEVEVGNSKKLSLANLEGDYENMYTGISNEYHTEILDDVVVSFSHSKSKYSLYVSFTPIAAGTASFDAEFYYTVDDEECSRIYHCTVIVSEPEVEELTGTYKIKVSPVFNPGVKLSKSKISLSSGSHASLSSKVSYYIDGGSGSSSYVPEGGESISVELYLYADVGYGFADADWVTVLVNGEAVDLDPNECTQEYLIVHADFQVAEAPPVITKDPSGETVNEGGSCSFVAHASGNADVTWYITDDDDFTVRASRAKNEFTGLKVSGYSEDKLKLSNIPASLDGYYVYAVFSNDAGETETERALIRVNPDETPTPRPTKTPKPTPTPTPTPMPTNPPVVVSTPVPVAWNTSVPTVQPQHYATATPAEHVHQYSLTKTHDDSYHYNVCSCGSKTNIEPHSFNTTESKGYLTKTCTVCGYTVTEKTSSANNIMVYLLIGVIVVLFLIIILGIVYLKKEGRL